MTNPLTSLISYLRSAKAELQKVAWPSRQDTLRYSLLVVGASAVMAAFFAAIDLGLGQTTTFLLARRGATQNTATSTQPVAPEFTPIEGIDANGNSVPLKVTPLNEGGNAQGGVTVTPPVTK
ncbi:MAG: preprotein translocase subunit SecE [Candidatus Uhrbacteria bacterium]